MPIRAATPSSFVELVAADATEVVAAEVEEQALDQLAGVVTRGRIARAQLVDLDQGLGLRRVRSFSSVCAMYGWSVGVDRANSALISSLSS